MAPSSGEPCAPAAASCPTPPWSQIRPGTEHFAPPGCRSGEKAARPLGVRPDPVPQEVRQSERHPAGRTRQPLYSLPAQQRPSVTIDHGGTGRCSRPPTPLSQAVGYLRSRHGVHRLAIPARLGVQTWFCDPRAPWQKGTRREHQSTRQKMAIERYRPAIEQDDLHRVRAHLNSTLRKCLGFKTPAEGPVGQSVTEISCQSCSSHFEWNSQEFMNVASPRHLQETTAANARAGHERLNDTNSSMT